MASLRALSVRTKINAIKGPGGGGIFGRRNILISLDIGTKDMGTMLVVINLFMMKENPGAVVLGNATFWSKEIQLLGTLHD